MKPKFSLSLVALFLSFFTQAQERGNITGKFYILDVDVIVREYDLTKDSLNRANLTLVAKAGTRFTAYEFKDSNQLLVKFWDYNKVDGGQDQPKLMGLTSYDYISHATNGSYFLMGLDDFNKKASQFHGFQHGFAWGFSTLPIKLRFGGDDRVFEYATGFSLGVNAGYEWQIRSRVKQSVGLLGGIGISTVGIDPATVKDNYIDRATTTGAFTPSIGAVYSYENFQIGLFVGGDYIPGELGNKWVYKNQPWFGLGLGFTIFQRNMTADGGKKQNQGD